MNRPKIFSFLRNNAPVELEIRLNPRKIFTLLGTNALVLSLTSLITQALVYLAGSKQAAWFIPLVDVDHEMSLPSIFSTILFFCIVILLIFICKIKLNERDPFRWHWLFLCFIFLFLCFDEGASIHELFSAPTENLLGNNDLPGFVQYAWVLPASVLVLAVAGLCLKFLFSLPKYTQRWLVIAGLIYLGGALGMETVGAIYAGVHGVKNLVYNLFVTIEEFMEMSGLILILYAFSDYVKMKYALLRIRLQG